jgi:uncharacterized protein YgbK (DUF1537 family)
MTRSTPLYCFYGDDFTGSTDVLEALASGGLRTVLFVGPPTAEHLQKFADCRAVGIAGDARSRSPTWMDQNLPALFASLRDLGAPIVHYKVCSTFDSAPRTGSIGRAMEIGRDNLDSPFVPIVVGAPRLRRYVTFGTLFAAAGDQVYRIDRHPTMRRHPVTPMFEADLRKHLAAQTSMRVGLIDLPTLQSGRAGEQLDALLRAGKEAVLFDGVDDSTLAETGRLIWAHAQKSPLFAVGSSGLTYSLLPALRSASGERSPGAAPILPTAVDRLLVMSGSCSPVTASQIQWALKHGYAGIQVDPEKLLDLRHSADAANSYVREASEALQARSKVVMYSALGPLSAGATAHDDSLGHVMGEMLNKIITATHVRRIVLAGGDTSSHAVSHLELHALTWIASLQPGAPLCRGHSNLPVMDGLELVLKGGQIGSDDFFERVRRGVS